MCLCAPDGYLCMARPMDEWNAYLAVESIVESDSGSSNRLHSFIAAICSQAAAKKECDSGVSFVMTRVRTAKRFVYGDHCASAKHD